MQPIASHVPAPALAPVPLDDNGEFPSQIAAEEAEASRGSLTDVESTLPPIIGIDLFAGAGGFSLGAFRAGVQVVAAVEKNSNACTTYRANLIDSGQMATRLFETDILKLDPQTVLNEAQLQAGDCDILLGGPPCQGFSSHRLRDSGVNDPRNALLLRYFDFVRTIRPKFFLVENVPGMLWERHRDYVEQFYGLAAENDYELLPPVILNAKDYGVPQNRKRVFLFGTDRRSGVSCAWPPPPTHVSPDTIGRALEQPVWNTAACVFASPARANDANDVHMKHNAALTAAFQRTPPNGGSRFASGRTLKCHEMHSGHYDVYGRIDPNAPGPTMTTACINPSKGRFVHPTEPHGITLRQAARFQTFPDWFTFYGGLMAGGEQVGNAVPVDMAEALIAPIVAACRQCSQRGTPE